MRCLQVCTQNQIEAQRKRVRFGKEEQNERALTFEKSRSKRYDACSDVVRLKGLEPIRIAAREPKSRMSANSITGAYLAAPLPGVEHISVYQ